MDISLRSTKPQINRSLSLYAQKSLFISLAYDCFSLSLCPTLFLIFPVNRDNFEATSKTLLGNFTVSYNFISRKFPGWSWIFDTVLLSILGFFKAFFIFLLSFSLLCLAASFCLGFGSCWRLLILINPLH